MHRAVLDSSVLISALLTPGGVSGRLLDAAERGDIRSCLSGEILVETAAALLRKRKLHGRYGFNRAAVEAFCDGLEAVAEMVAGLPPLRSVPDDPKDDVIVATVVAAGAGFLVTGDRKHLLSLGSYRDIRILWPRGFLELLGA